ncbi:HAD-IA family hydrolase, partial [bacterium]|nr:HAD-IA family hydrolase [bacterium]
IEILKVYYCIHTEEENCPCRKPKPGLLLKAKEEIKDFEFSETYFIGDTEKDIKAGKSVGTKTVLLLSGATKPQDIEKFEEKPDFIFNNLKEAAIELTKRK